MNGPEPPSDYRAALRAVADSGMKQGILAREMGVSQSSISRWIRGECTPTPVYQRLICYGLMRVRAIHVDQGSRGPERPSG